MGGNQAGARERAGSSRLGSRVQPEDRLKRLGFRAWHRGVREADYMIGGFFDAHAESLDEDQIAWFEALLEEQDADIMAWAIGTAQPPERYRGAMMRRLQQLDYIKHPE
jgi:antitoxin CptB